jgi:hypothetical protein
MTAITTFLQSALWSGLIILLFESLLVGIIIWAENKTKRDAWEKQETRKMKAVRR